MSSTAHMKKIPVDAIKSVDVRYQTLLHNGEVYSEAISGLSGALCFCFEDDGMRIVGSASTSEIRHLLGHLKEITDSLSSMLPENQCNNPLHDHGHSHL